MKVEWGDAHTGTSWHYGAPPCEPVPVTSVGFVMDHNSKGILIAQGMSPNTNGTWDSLNRTFVPSGMITKVVEL